MAHRDEFRKRAQALRREGTKEENHLWYDFLRGYPVQFKRQAVFGDYIVDFYCPQAKLAVEVDGSQHYEEKGQEYDRQRTDELKKIYGLEIVRFTNIEINHNFEGVCLEIDRQVRRKAPSSAPCGAPSPCEGEGS